MKSSNEKIKLSLLDIFNKLNTTSTHNVGIDIFRELVKSNISNENRMIYIISTVSEHISAIKKTEKKDAIRLISVFCESTDDVKQIFPYISRLLTILQANITDENASIFTLLSSTFAEIVENCLKSEITSIEKDENSTDEKNNKKIYEILQGFCIYNMKQELKANQICGSLCLTALIETCPLVLQPCYLKYIWENIVLFIDKVNFAAKLELLNCLISIIFASESLFRPYATVTLYKILDFLTDNDWLKRKLALNVVYTLVFYCQEEIVPLKSHIVEFLKVLKSDKVKEVREICMQTLKFINENSHDESITELNDADANTENAKGSTTMGISNTNASSSPNLTKKKANEPIAKEQSKPSSCNNVISSSGLPFTKPQESNAKKKKSTESTIKMDKNKPPMNNIIPKTEANQGYNSVMKKNYSIQDDQLPNQLSENSNNSSNIRRAVTPTKMNKKKEKEKEREIQNRSQDDSSIGHISKNIKDTSQELKPNRIINVNRNKEDNSFVNSKMVLKRDPNYSIFKTCPNTEFFEKAQKNEKGVEILVKKKESKKGRGPNVDPELNNEQPPISVKEPRLNYIKVEKKSNYPATIGEQPLNGSFTHNLEVKDSNELHLNENTNSPSLNPLKTSETFSIGKVEYKSDVAKDRKWIFNEEDLPSLKVKDEEIEVFQAITNEKKSCGNILDYETKENNNNTPSQNNMKEILRQMKIMSDKQIFLIDTIEKIQTSSQEQIDNLKEKIVKLENTIEKLTGIIYSTMQNNPISSSDVGYINGMNSNSNSNSNSTINRPAMRGGDTTWSSILQELKARNPTEAFNIALKSDDVNLMKLIEKVNTSQIKEVEQQVLEDSMSRLITLLTRGDNIIIITSFFKNVLIVAKSELKRVTLQNIKDILLYLASNKSQFILKEEEMVNINLILSHITAANENKNTSRPHFEGYSNIINSFANN